MKKCSLSLIELNILIKYPEIFFMETNQIFFINNVDIY